MIERIRSQVRRWDANAGPEDAVAAEILLSSVVVGPDVGRIAELTGRDILLIKQIGNRLIKNGIWVEGGVLQNWADPEVGGVEFTLAVACALGFIERAVHEPDRKVKYRQSNHNDH